jgi:phosphate starvation-inducible PhoH-like protein
MARANRNSYDDYSKKRGKPRIVPPVTPSKYAEQNQERLYQRFTPTPEQKTLHNKMRSNTLVFVDAVAGTGKSAGVLWLYCQEYLKDPTKQIVITRTPVEAGADKIGFLPNDLSAKIEPHFASSRKLLEEFLGKAKVETDLGKRIHFLIPNYVLGSTLDNTLWFIDEAQQIQPLIMKLLLERIGTNTKCVVGGSSEQLYVTDKNRNGLADAKSRFFDYTEEFGYLPRYDDVEYHTFGIDHVMRHDIVKTVIKAYNGIGG